MAAEQLTTIPWDPVLTEARRSRGSYTRLLNERSGFERWLGLLCCVLGQDLPFYPWPGVKIGSGEFNAGS